MELMIGNTTVAQTGATAGKTVSGTGKTEGQGGFGQLLEAAGLSLQTAGTDESTTDQEGLLAALAALAGGLSPLLLSGLQQPEITAEGTEQGLTLTVQTGEGNLSLLLNDLPLNNSELAFVLQEFGASADLLTVLFNKPQGNPIETLQANPHLLPEFGSALTQMVQTLTAQPQLLVQETHTAVLFKSLMQSVQIETVQEDASASDRGETADTAFLPVKANSLLGKLQATISMHTLQASLTLDDAAVTANTVANKAGSAVNTAATAQNAVSGTGTEETAAAVKSAPETQQKPVDTAQTTAVAANQSYLQLPQRNLKLEPVVTMRADQFRAEFTDTVIKRASLIEAPGRHEFRIILEPQGLGEVEVRIQSVNKQISVQLIADSLASKGMLDSALAGLKLQLQAQGIPYDRIEVQTSSQNNTDLGSGLQEHRGSGQNAREQQQGGQSRQVTADTFTLSEGETLADDGLLTPDSIDVTA